MGCLLCVKGLVIYFNLGWPGSILQFRQNMIKVGSKSWLLTCSSYITLSLLSYTGSALKSELTFCNGYLSQCIFGYGSALHNKLSLDFVTSCNTKVCLTEVMLTFLDTLFVRSQKASKFFFSTEKEHG